MTTRTTILATAAATATLAIGVALGAQASSPGTGQGAVTEKADPALATTLQMMREEERMARDLYAALAKEHDGARPMSMITMSEQKHVDAVGTLLQRYAVSDPSAGKAAGTYAFPELQALYDQWWAQGKVSLPAAYQVGIELETRDIADLKAAMNSVTQADVDRVLGNLLRGSENHLAAYQGAAAGKATTGPGRQSGPGQHGMGAGQGQGRQGAGQGMGRQGQGQGQGQHECPYDTTT